MLDPDFRIRESTRRRWIINSCCWVCLKRKEGVIQSVICGSIMELGSSPYGRSCFFRKANLERFHMRASVPWLNRATNFRNDVAPRPETLVPTMIRTEMLGEDDYAVYIHHPGRTKLSYERNRTCVAILRAPGEGIASSISTRGSFLPCAVFLTIGFAKLFAVAFARTPSPNCHVFSVR